MKLIYINHSGFAIEANDYNIIIDYFRDSEVGHQKGIVHNDLLKQEKRLYVLCSHSHPDHFNKEILEWRNKVKDIHYIFSKDIYEAQLAEGHDALYMDKGDVFQDEYLRIKAYGSTDLGISFFIETENKLIFHAGDLNNWHWNEESTQEEIKEAEDWYTRELNLLASEVRHLDLAMFPVDPRLGKDYMLGAQQFINAIQVDLFSPMHCQEQYDKAAAFVPYAEAHGTKCICWKQAGESIDF